MKWLATLLMAAAFVFVLVNAETLGKLPTRTPTLGHRSSSRQWRLDRAHPRRRLAVLLHHPRCYRSMASSSGGSGGSTLLGLFGNHSTARPAHNEAGSGTEEDLLRALDDVLSADGRWRLRRGGPGTVAITSRRHSWRPRRAGPGSVAGSCSGPGSRCAWVGLNVSNSTRQIRLSFLPA